MNTNTAASAAAPDSGAPAAAPADATAGASAAAGETLLTKGVQADASAADPAAGTPPPGKTDPAKPETKADGKQEPPDPLAQVPESPDGYTLAFGEGVTVDTGLLGTFQTTAHELGLNQGQAQKLAELYATHTAGAEQKQTAALKQTVTGWEKEITASPGFEGQNADAQRALASFGSAELFEVMDQTLIGSHPAMFNFMANIGKALAEPDFKGKGGNGSSSMSTEEYLRTEVFKV